MPHRLPSAQRNWGPGEPRPCIRLRTQEQDAEVEQQNAVCAARGQGQLQQGEVEARPQRGQIHEVGVDGGLSFTT